MKKTDRKLAFILFLIALTANIAIGQDATGLPGDNFSLDGALELFQKSHDLAAFEKALNKTNNKVNNLDLNEDGDIDYVRVIDNMEGDVHAIVLQVPYSQSESQDIAVIEIEKNGASSASLQIIGDEDIYGEDMVIEPFTEEGSGGKGGPDANYDIIRISVNVWLWTPVRAIYAPRYTRYVSPWRWGRYPSYWKPWRPLTWNLWHPHRYHYPARYRVTTHRLVVAHRVYTPVRKRTTVVRTRTTRVLATNGNRTVVRNYNNTNVVRTNGQKTVAVNKKTGRVAASNGKVKKVSGKKKVKPKAKRARVKRKVKRKRG